MNTVKVLLCLSFFFLMTSCIKQIDLHEDQNNKEGDEEPTTPAYIYPFKDEVQNAVAEIMLKVDAQVSIEDIKIEIPYLKYNKSWLCLLTQDDCKQAAFCRTWAAINGQPVSSSIPYPTTPSPHDLYYDISQLQKGDLPPSIIPAEKSLGCTDGAGNEVRFAITTTLAPEAKWMNAKSDVKPGFSENYYRFYMKSGLIWNNVIEMLNYGTGIALHDVDAPNVNNPADILKHFAIAQDSILKRLSGRGAKFMAEPNGNKTYVTAAQQYTDIQTMVAQAGATTLRPFQVKDDLQKQLLSRIFNDSPDYFKKLIEQQLALPKEQREAISIGVHGTDNAWVELLTWINDTYGKDGDNSVWFPSQEEYYEYNYYRINSTTRIEKVDNSTWKLTVTLPSKQYFYYPAITVNLKGLKKQNISSIASGDAVSGLSYADIEDGIMLNIDCRKFLIQHATHFVERYEKDKSNKSKKADGIYFANKLKESNTKVELLKRLK